MESNSNLHQNIAEFLSITNTLDREVASSFLSHSNFDLNVFFRIFSLFYQAFSLKKAVHNFFENGMNFIKKPLNKPNKKPEDLLRKKYELFLIEKEKKRNNSGFFGLNFGFFKKDSQIQEIELFFKSSIFLHFSLY